MTTQPPDPPDFDAVGDFQQLILDTIVGTFEHYGVDLPDRRYIVYGEAAADCEQLTVALGQVYSGLPAEDPNALQRCDGPITSVNVVQLFRKVPLASGPRGTGAPSADALTASARAFARDAWILLVSAGEISKSGWNTGFTAEVSPISPSGGYAGLSMTFTAAVP